MVEVSVEALMSVIVGDKTYYDASNGIMNSHSPLHRVEVSMEALDKAKAYTVCIRPIVKRKPYFTETSDVIEFQYNFHPVPKQNIRAFHISDTHNKIKASIEAGKAFGKIDFLILNGDIIDHSGDPEKFSVVYEICSALTCGSVPVVFSRGNHDMRGNFAEKFADYTPSRNHNTYYTFRLGSVWGLVLDCGEDKSDDHPEYGFTVACHAFREQQTDYIRTVIQKAAEEYQHDGVTTKLVIAHCPFTQQLSPPFNIEADIYREWASLLKDYIKPDLMICGHMHRAEIRYPGDENDHLGQPCTMVIAAEPQGDRFIGGGFIINEDQIEVVFADNSGNTVLREMLKT